MSNVRRATTGGRRAAFVIVLHSMWRRAEGKFALIVLALWLLIAIVSLFWTPQSLWATDGYHVWAKPSAEHWLGTDGTGADVRLVQSEFGIGFNFTLDRNRQCRWRAFCFGF